VKGLANDSGIEVADPGHVLWPASHRRGRDEKQGEKPGCRAAAKMVEVGHGRRSRAKEPGRIGIYLGKL